MFHYFTNGYYIYTHDYSKSFTYKETVVHPGPWDSWRKEWLTLIKRKERKKLSITYQHFDKVPAGKYKICFSFPGLNNLSQKDRKLGSGRIWMGDIYTEKEITIK